jgi:hypothetical protein
LGELTDIIIQQILYLKDIKLNLKSGSERNGSETNINKIRSPVLVLKGVLLA